jgi:hypothetical protein
MPLLALGDIGSGRWAAPIWQAYAAQLVCRPMREGPPLSVAISGRTDRVGNFHRFCGLNGLLLSKPRRLRRYAFTQVRISIPPDLPQERAVRLARFIWRTKSFRRMRHLADALLRHAGRQIGPRRPGPATLIRDWPGRYPPVGLLQDGPTARVRGWLRARY